jgi:hypothetical protein
MAAAPAWVDCVSGGHGLITRFPASLTVLVPIHDVFGGGLLTGTGRY